MISHPSLVAAVRVVFLGRDRAAWRLVLLYLVTLGIHRRIWLYHVNKELDGHEALALNHRWLAFLLCLPVLGPAIVTFQTALRTRRMIEASDVRYGPPKTLGLLGTVFILGPLFFIPWEQSRLNKFWAYERARPGHGIEIDIDLSKDPSFLVELGQAMKASYHAGSRFDRKRKARAARMQARKQGWSALRAERAAVRAAGGSTPVLPWRAPERPAARLLHITCGRCEQKFDVTQDPTVETPVVCPKCGLTEVLPGLHSNPLAKREAVGIPEVSATCPSCKTTFRAVRDLHGPTKLTCPKCGRAETLPAPGAPALPAKRRRSAA